MLEEPLVFFAHMDAQLIHPTNDCYMHSILINTWTWGPVEKRKHGWTKNNKITYIKEKKKQMPDTCNSHGL